MTVTKNASLKKGVTKADALKILINKYVAYEATKSIVISKGWITEEQCKTVFASTAIKEEISKAVSELTKKMSETNETQSLDSLLNSLINE